MAVFESRPCARICLAQFLKWFTARAEYPVCRHPQGIFRKDGHPGISRRAFKMTGDAENAEMVEHSIETELKAMREQEFYIRSPEGSYDMNQIFTSSLENKTALDLHEPTAGGRRREP